MNRKPYRFKITDLYFVIFILGYAAMPYMVQSQFERRGYLGFGGEWLIPVLAIAVIEIFRQVAIMAIYAYEDNKRGN